MAVRFIPNQAQPAQIQAPRALSCCTASSPPLHSGPRSPWIQSGIRRSSGSIGSRARAGPPYWGHPHQGRRVGALSPPRGCRIRPWSHRKTVMERARVRRTARRRAGRPPEARGGELSSPRNAVLGPRRRKEGRATILSSSLTAPVGASTRVAAGTAARTPWRPEQSCPHVQRNSLDKLKRVLETGPRDQTGHAPQGACSPSVPVGQRHENRSSQKQRAASNLLSWMATPLLVFK